MLALVVEDDPSVRAFLGRALAQLDYESDGVATAAEAEARVDGGRAYDVVLLDGLLPDGHGLALARRLIARQGTARTAICLLSGTVRRPSPVTAGISALGKPPRLADLLEHVEQMRRWRLAGSSAAEREAALDALEAGLLVG